MANPLSDLLSGHPIRAIQDIPGEQFLQHLAGKTIGNVIEGIEGFPAGVYTLGKTALLHPSQLPSLGEEMAKQFVTSFEHPLRRPGDTLLNVLALSPFIAAPALRGVEAASIAGRGGALPKALEGLTKEEAAAKGLSQQYNRIVNPETGAINPVNLQVKEALLRGPAQQERLIRVGQANPDELNLENTKMFTTPDGIVTHGWWYSKDPLIRSAQKLIDRMYEKHANDLLDGGLTAPIWQIARKGTPFWRTQSGRFEAAAKAYNLTVAKEAKSEAAAFGREWGTASDSFHLALRMVAEGVTPKALRSAHERWLSSGKLGPKLRGETERRLAMIPEAEKLLQEKTITDEVTGVKRTVPIPDPENPEFVRYVEEGRALSQRRSHASIAAGVLSPSSHYGRLVSPFSVVHHDQVPEYLTTLRKKRSQFARNMDKNAEKVAALDARIAQEEHGAQLSFDVQGGEFDPSAVAFKGGDEEMKRFADAAQLFRVPYAFDRPGIRGRLAPGGFYRRAYGGRKPRVPSSYTHHYTGAILRGGGGDTNVARLLAESYTEAHRFLGLRAVRSKLLAGAHLTPENIPEQYRQLVRTDEDLPPGLNITQAQAERLAHRQQDALFDKEKLSPEEMVAGGKLYEGIRADMFPTEEQVAGKLEAAGKWTKKQIDSFLGRGGQEFRPVPGYRWIDKRQLGGLDRKNPLTFAYDNAIVRNAIRGTDAINTIIRGIMLYLRPAYAVPNMLGNIGLNLVQHGAAAPFHAARHYGVWRQLSKADRDIMKVQLGEGVGESGFRQMTGLGAKVQGASAYVGKQYGRLVDEPFRVNSFLYEAGQMGYRTASEVKALLREPKNAEDLRAVTNRANEAIINYERMGPGEEALARRLILFYPFIKGASRYANYFFKEHPGAAAIQQNVGELGRSEQERLLGALPSWASSLIPYGGSRNFPLTGNPISTGILSEPADITKSALQLVGPHPIGDMAFAGNLAPVESALLTALTLGKWTSLQHKPGQNVPQLVWQELAGGLPPQTLAHRIMHESAQGGPLATSVYPDPSLAHAILSFMFSGGLTERRTNKALLNYRAYLQEHPR